VEDGSETALPEIISVSFPSLAFALFILPNIGIENETIPQKAATIYI
jgi:hypothetical protein